MEFSNPYITNRAKINCLQRWVLVHSMLYYMFDAPIISDHMYDNNSKELAKLQRDDPVAFDNSRFKHAFAGFDGSTGFDLIAKLTAREQHTIATHAKYAYFVAKGVDLFGKSVKQKRKSSH